MQKKIIALAVAGLMSGAAFAQSNVEIYGIVDMGYANASSGQTGTKNLVQSGMLSDSRIGFRGTEDLGGGMKANFVLEHGLNADTGAQAVSGTTDATSASTKAALASGSTDMWARTASVGLSGNFGAINLGRQYTPIFNVMAASDVSINSAIVSDFGNTGATARSSNSVKYTSPSFSGFTAQVMYAAGETLNTAASDAINSETALLEKNTGNQLGLSLAYAAGPLSVGYGHHETKIVYDTPGAAAADLATTNKEDALGAAYDFKVVKVFGLFVTDKNNDGSAKVRTWQLQGAFGVGPGTMVVSYFDRDDRVTADADSRGIGLAYLYPMSKRTTLYAAWGRRSNQDAASTALNKGVAPAAAGYDPKLLGIGVRHTF